MTAPKKLFETLETLKALSEVSQYLTIIEAAMPTMVQLATTGYDTQIDIGLGPQNVNLDWANEDADKSTLALNDQMKANGGKLDITVLVDEYKAADSKAQFLVENGKKLREVVADTQVHLSNILKPTIWNLILDYAPAGDEKDTFKLFI